MQKTLRPAVALALVLLLLLLGVGVIAAGLAWLRAGGAPPPIAAPGSAVSAEAPSGSSDAAAPGERPRERRRRVDAATAGAPGSPLPPPGAPGEGAAPDDGDDADDGSGESPAPVVTPAPGEDASPPRVRGRVVDAEGSAITDARVLIVTVGRGWFGDRTDETGAFDAERADDGTGRVEVRVAKPGYRLAIVPWTAGDGDVAVRLEPEDQPPPFGTVRGIATGLSGTPLTGRLLVESYDAMEDHRGDWTVAGPGGEFVLVGFPAGYRRLRLAGAPVASFVETRVPAGDSVRVHLRGGEAPWPGDLDEPTFRQRHADLSRRMTLLRTDAERQHAADDAEAWRVAFAMQDLESRWRGVAPAREVVVSGLPSLPGSVLRAASTHGPNHRWVVRIDDGRARFPALTMETWRLSIDVPGRGHGKAVDIRVVPGDAPFLVAWDAPRGDEEGAD